MSWKVKEDHGWSFPITRLTIQVRKVMCGWLWWWLSGLLEYSPSPSPFPLDFGVWIWDFDLGLGFGTGLGVDNSQIKINIGKLSVPLPPALFSPVPILSFSGPFFASPVQCLLTS